MKDYMSSRWQQNNGKSCAIDLPSTLKSINAQEVHTELHGRLGMPNGGALVKDNDAGLLEFGDDRARRVASCLDDLDALIDDDLGICVIVGRDQSRKKSDVDGERSGGHLPALADFLTKTLRLGPDQSGKDAQTASVGHSARQFRISHVL